MSRLRTKALSITKQSWELFQRMFVRSVALAIFTATGLSLVDHLIANGLSDRFAIVHRFPEFIPWLVAAATLTFIEMSVFWIRFCVQPGIDSQLPAKEIQKQAWDNYTALAILHGIETAKWMFRVVVLIYLAH